MQTYNKTGHIHGRFNSGRHGKYDALGRKNATDFFESMGWSVGDNDKNSQGETIFNEPDLKATKSGKADVFVEAAVKRSKLWKYLKEGVDIETRKLKYFKDGKLSYVGMSNEEGTEFILIPMDCLNKAQLDCGSEYKGQGVSSSSGFNMPAHGCHRVRKVCSKGFNQSGTTEDFYRIPYEYCPHYRKDESGKWVQQNKLQMVKLP